MRQSTPDSGVVGPCPSSRLRRGAINGAMVPLGLIAGAQVLLQGLNSRQDVNGREAELLSGPHHENRWAVRIITTGECIRVKPANFHRSPGLHTHLNSDAIALVFRQCCGRSLRALCATDQAISALAKAALLAGEWRRRIDARLKEWKASSPVYGFFSLEGSQDRSGLCMSRSTTGDLVANSFVDTLQEVSWRMWLVSLCLMLDEACAHACTARERLAAGMRMRC